MNVANRHVAVPVLRHLLGEEIAEAVLNRKWTLVALVAPVLGLISDCVQTIGPFADIAFVVSLLLFVATATIVHFNWRYCEQCKGPRIGLFIFVVVFGVVCGLQWATDARKEGVIATYSPEIRHVLTEMGLRFDSVEKKIDRNTAAIVNQIENLNDQIKEYAKDSAVPPELVLWQLRQIYGPDMKRADIPERLAQTVQNYKRLESEVGSTSLTPAAQAARERALRLVEQGRVEDADSLLQDAERRVEALGELHRRDQGQLLADQAKVAAMRGDYERAARTYDQAAKLWEKDPVRHTMFLLERAEMLECQGYWFNDLAYFHAGIDAYNAIIESAPNHKLRSDALLGLAGVLVSLGYTGLAESEYERALSYALRAELLQSETQPSAELAKHHRKFGYVLSAVGGFKGDAELIRKSLNYFRSAANLQKNSSLTEFARRQWDIANALTSLAYWTRDSNLLQEAENTYRAAIDSFEKCTFSCASREIARVRVDLGWLYYWQARFVDATTLQKAIVEFHKAVPLITLDSSRRSFIALVNGLAWSHLRLVELQTSEDNLRAAGHFIRLLAAVLSPNDNVAKVDELWLKGLLHSMHGERELNKDKLEFGVTILERAMELAPSNTMLQADLEVARLRLARAVGNSDAVLPYCMALKDAINKMDGTVREAYAAFRRRDVGNFACGPTE
jgi:tetratricopeptide (TPR) repeat protein